MNQVEELSKLVARLAHSLKKARPGSKLPDKAVDYLKRHDLQCSPLRTSGPTCRECGEPKECMGGCSAHPDNWHCPLCT